MRKIENIAAGLAGAVALNVLHQSLKNANGTPRVDLVGEEALERVLGFFGTGINDGENLYQATLAGDLISNTLYYSLIGAGAKRFLWGKAILLGLGAGIGAVNLPEPMGLNDKPVAATNQRKILTVAYYLTGALVTAFLVKAFNRK